MEPRSIVPTVHKICKGACNHRINVCPCEMIIQSLEIKRFNFFGFKLVEKPSIHFV